MKQKKLWAGIFALVILFNAAAQETEVFAPFVTQLDGEIRNNLIRLSWKDAEDIRGPVYVYRSEAPFSDLAVLPVPVEVAYGVGSYYEETENSGIFHYFVVASDEWGRKYPLSIPNTNTVSITVEPENALNFAINPGNSQGRAAISAGPVPSIREISALAEEDRVIISFTGADNSKNLILYRSVNPIRQKEDLLSALIIRQKISSPVIDYPLPGINYYYALIYEEELSAGVFDLRPGSNTTGAVQIIPVNRSFSRDMPLPGLNLSSAAMGGPSSAAASQDSEAGGVFSDRKSERAAKLETEVFPEDLARGGAGEEGLLRSIVQGYFSLKEWGKAENEFRSFLDLPRTQRNRARARFYLGQVYYFQQKPKEALFEFLAAQEEYPEDSNSWIQAVLAAIIP